MTFIPTVIESSPRSDRVVDLISCLLKERIVLLTSPIDDAVAGNLCAQLLYLASRSAEDIQLYIHSGGGSVSAGLAIYDTMHLIRCDVSTICLGMAASMAAVILAGGARGKRFALPNSDIMIHQPLGGVQGQAADVKIAAEHILELQFLEPLVGCACIRIPVTRFLQIKIYIRMDIDSRQHFAHLRLFPVLFQVFTCSGRL